MSRLFLKYSLTVLLVAGTLGVLFIWDAAQDEAAIKKELELLEGTWEVDSLVCAGEELKAPPIGWNRVIFDRDGSYEEEENRDYSSAGILKLHPRRQPKAFEIIVLEGGIEGGRTDLPGIYLLQGDKLWMCTGDPRPTEFVSERGSNRSLTIYRRAKPKH
jgi:uncharacterized protein (TIGR03067 family)